MVFISSASDSLEWIPFTILTGTVRREGERSQTVSRNSLGFEESVPL
jgi:hypothetical protein